MTPTTRHIPYGRLVGERRSIRAYRPTPVTREELQHILATANLAPSAGDLQAYEIVVVESAQTRGELAAAAQGQGHVAEAPLVLAFCADPGRSQEKYGRRGAELFAVQDATIACAYAQLAAAELVLGTCWIGAFDEDAVRALLQLPAAISPVALLTVGHAAEQPPPTPRRSLDDLVRVETFDRRL